jgi:predicted RNA methylase
MTSAPYLPGMETEYRSRDLSAWYTPPETASNLWRWASSLGGRYEPFTVLEPSAGDGALVRPMIADPGLLRDVVMYEIDQARTPRLLDICMESSRVDVSLRPRNFLADTDPGRFSVTVMNPPYEPTPEYPVGQDVEFIEHALNCSSAVVGLFRSAFVHGSGRWSKLWRFTDVQRLAWLSSRPDFGGDQSAKADFVALELTRRDHARLKGEPMASNTEWW